MMLRLGRRAQVRIDIKLSARTGLRYAAAGAIVLASGVLAELFFRFTGLTRPTSIYLGGVLLAATLLGSGPAYFAGAFAFLLYLWQFDPRFAFKFGSIDDFDTLMVFLAVSALIGLLVGRIRQEAAAARARARSTAALLAATREFAASSDEDQIRRRLAEYLANAARGTAVVRSGEAVAAAPQASEGLAGPGSEAGWFVRPLQAGAETLGQAAWRAEGEPLTPQETAVLDVLADTGAAALARTRLTIAKAEAESRARTEDLRNAVLSSVSHDLRTPLAAILASATSLYEFGETFDAATRRDLSATIQEEALRLEAFVGNLLHMSRLEGGALPIARAPFSVAEVIVRTVERRSRGARAAVSLSLAPRLDEALGDPGLFEQAFGNVLENALRYTPQEAPVLVRAERAGARIRVEVLDEGPGVPKDELPRIFEKFYRARGASPRGGGVGLGLAITRGLLEGMGGGVDAANRPDGPGFAVGLELPVAS